MLRGGGIWPTNIVCGFNPMKQDLGGMDHGSSKMTDKAGKTIELANHIVF